MKEQGHSCFRTSIHLAILVLVLFSGRDVSASLPLKRVLVLYPLDKEHPAHELTDRGIHAAFDANQKLDIQLYTEYMDFLRFGSPGYRETLAQFFAEKYLHTKPDVIITVYPSALNFLLRYGDSAFPGIPVVACSIYESDFRALEDTVKMRRITGTFLKSDIGDIIPVIRGLRPETRRVALVTGSSELDKHAFNLIGAALKANEPEVEIMELAGLPMPDLLERLGSLPSDSVILYSSIYADGAGKVFVPREALRMVSQAANVPVFGLLDSFFGYGIVGGGLLRFEAHGQKAAEQALRILTGETPGDIPFTAEGMWAYMFDWRELNRWGLSEEALPKGSTVKFKPLSMWEEHRGTILGGSVFMIIETLLIVGLLVNLHRRRRAEVEIAASSLRYRTVADYTYDWEYWSAPNGTLNYVSPSCERITGYSAREFMDDPSLFVRVIVPEDREIWDKHDHEARTDLKRREIQFRIRARDGVSRWIDHACQPVTDAQGKFLGIRASNRDITERKKSENELKESYLENRRLKDLLAAESDYLKEEISLQHNFKNIVGKSDALKYVLYRLEQVAATDSTVLLLGETGTGKELIARAIHGTSKRQARTLIKVNCAALQANLIESELFGHEKGAFTGAVAHKLGRFELAHKGTLFLDEIGELSLDFQSKLLRVIEDGEFERLGSSKTIKADVRIIAATNRDLEKEIRAGRFREDLWYRLKVFTITLPPLRERLEDLALLVQHFLGVLNKDLGRSVSKVPSSVIETLQRYHWPGNVRELKYVIMRAVVGSSGDILQLSEPLAHPVSPPLLTTKDLGSTASFLKLEEMERRYILEVLAQVKWKIEGKDGAAEILDINPGTLRSRMKKLGIRKLQ